MEGGREWREGVKEGGRKGGRGGREWREGVKEGGRKGGREGREGGSEKSKSLH